VEAAWRRRSLFMLSLSEDLDGGLADVRTEQQLEAVSSVKGTSVDSVLASGNDAVNVATAFANAAAIPGTAADTRTHRQRSDPYGAWYVQPPRVQSYPPADHPNREPLRLLLLAKRRAIQVLLEAPEGSSPREALNAAYAEARKSQRATPNGCLKHAGWFGVSAEPECITSFEAAAAMVETAFSLQ